MSKICEKLPKNIIDIMKKQIKETDIDGKERGFLICTSAKKEEDINDKNTISLKECIGHYCYIDIRGKCPNDKPIRGSYHTHLHTPDNISDYPSYGDFLDSKKSNEKFICVGSVNIMCMHMPEKMFNDEKEMYKWIRKNNCIIRN